MILIPLSILLIVITITLCALLGKRSLKDLCLFFVGVFLFTYIEIVILTNFQRVGDWLSPTISGLLYGTICFIIFSISIRLLKSKIAFFFISWVVALVFLVRRIESAKEEHLTYLEYGSYMYIDGQITKAGLIYYIINPIWLMAIFATILLILELFRKRIAQKRLA